MLICEFHLTVSCMLENVKFHVKNHTGRYLYLDFWKYRMNDDNAIANMINLIMVEKNFRDPRKQEIKL